LGEKAKEGPECEAVKFGRSNKTHSTNTKMEGVRRLPDQFTHISDGFRGTRVPEIFTISEVSSIVLKKDKNPLEGLKGMGRGETYSETEELGLSCVGETEDKATKANTYKS